MAASTPYPTFTIDLDLPPRQRWQHVAKQYLPLVPELLDAYHTALKHEFGAFAFVTKWMAAALTIPADMEEEMRGLAEAAGLPYDGERWQGHQVLGMCVGDMWVWVVLWC